MVKEIIKLPTENEKNYAYILGYWDGRGDITGNGADLLKEENDLVMNNIELNDLYYQGVLDGANDKYHNIESFILGRNAAPDISKKGDIIAALSIDELEGIVSIYVKDQNFSL